MFGPQAARDLPGPDWLRARREAAAERLAEASLPTVDEEVWRYSRIGELDLARFSPPTSASSTDVPPEIAAMRRSVPDAAAVVVLRDGFVVHCRARRQVGRQGCLGRPGR